MPGMSLGGVPDLPVGRMSRMCLWADARKSVGANARMSLRANARMSVAANARKSLGANARVSVMNRGKYLSEVHNEAATTNTADRAIAHVTRYL